MFSNSRSWHGLTPESFFGKEVGKRKWCETFAGPLVRKLSRAGGLRFIFSKEMLIFVLFLCVFVLFFVLFRRSRAKKKSKKKTQFIPQKNEKHNSHHKKNTKKHNSYHKKNTIHTTKKSTNKNTIHTKKKVIFLFFLLQFLFFFGVFFCFFLRFFCFWKVAAFKAF